MSSNIPINSGGLERTAGSDPMMKPKVSNKDSSDSFHSLATITNVTDLKKAELKGENYTISDEQLIKAIEHAIKAMEGKSTTLQFSVHEKTKLIAVKVLDKTSGEVIREIPPEKSLDFVAKLWEMAGIIVDERR